MKNLVYVFSHSYLEKMHLIYQIFLIFFELVSLTVPDILLGDETGG